MNAPTIVNGVEIIPLDANHCPGAVMFLFKVPAGPGGKAQVSSPTWISVGEAFLLGVYHVICIVSCRC